LPAAPTWAVGIPFSAKKYAMTKDGSMSQEMILKNARVVTPTEVIEGSVLLRGGLIAEIQSGPVESASAVDLEGDYLIPGLIDLHTDNVERHIRPRRDADWPMLAALMAHDAEMTSVGITTVFDALYVGQRNIDPQSPGTLELAIAALDAGRKKKLFRAEHFLHLRAETSREAMPDIFAKVYPEPSVRMVSVMDHTPGQRQFANRQGNGGQYGGGRRRDRGSAEENAGRPEMSAEERQEKIAAPNRAKLLSMLAGHTIALASHDDTTVEHVEQAHAEGIGIAEFPTSVIAAQIARNNGMKIVAGSPNLVLGRSLSGNVSVEELARLGLLDALASDYVPASLLHGAFLLSEKIGIPLPEAIGTVTLNPARLTGLNDRGCIAPGKRADLVRVRITEGLPVLITVWREGMRVC
jgi:alpha-D-ribose 1-methylphosphonate 5-triphosphate diphosphatase